MAEKKHRLTSTILTPHICSYETTERFTEKSFKDFERSLKKIEGVASVQLKTDYEVIVRIGHLFAPITVQKEIKKFLNINEEDNT